MNIILLYIIMDIKYFLSHFDIFFMITFNSISVPPLHNFVPELHFLSSDLFLEGSFIKYSESQRSTLDHIWAIRPNGLFTKLARKRCCYGPALCNNHRDTSGCDPFFEGYFELLPLKEEFRHILCIWRILLSCLYSLNNNFTKEKIWWQLFFPPKSPYHFVLLISFTISNWA